jgi:hypothetical protein
MRRLFRIAAIAATGVLLAATTLAASPRAEKSAAAARGYGPGYGMMGGRGGYGGMMGGGMMGGYGGMMGPGGTWSQAQPLDKPLTLDTAMGRVMEALQAWGYADLEVEEVVQYSWNFYALVRDPSTGKGALELLVDPRTGVVSLEPGPGMMWNTRYGRMYWGGPSAASTMSAEDAKRIAREWLTARGDTTPWEFEVTEMPGYFTVHLEKDGRMEAMLGVNAFTGAVWYHTWHGTYVAAIELEM